MYAHYSFVQNEYEFLFCTESIPMMPKLLNFRAGAQYMNIPHEIGTNYDEFGIHLLQDDKGVRTSVFTRA